MPHFATTRLNTHALERRSPDGERVLLVHGNVSSSAFFGPLIGALPEQFHVLAPDLRGYGESEARPIDAARGLRDFADDVWALLEHVGWTERVHLLGWSLGGGVVTRLALDHPGAVASITLVAPISPHGFGGTRGEKGAPNSPDFAGSGGGTVNPSFVEMIANGERGEAAGSPRDVMRQFYFHTYYPPPELEERFLSAMLTTRTGADFYPGDLMPSEGWPGVAPGGHGVANAFSPKYLDLTGFANITPKPPVLWARGAHDRIVGDASDLDLARLGQLGVLPGWPGEEACPPQPMLAQTRAVLEAYKENGGTYRELVFPASGHSPFLEEPDAFLAAFIKHLAGA